MISVGTRDLVRHWGAGTVGEGKQDWWMCPVYMDYYPSGISYVQSAYLVPEDPAADPFFEEP